MISASSRCLAALLLTGPCVLLSAHAQLSDRDDGMRFVPDVPGQFRALTEFPDVIGFRLADGAPDPSTCRHYQAVVRIDGADGTPYMLVTRSGNLPNVPGPDDILCDDSPGETANGHLMVFRMDSRDKNGERLRNNRLRKSAPMDFTAPPAEDAVPRGENDSPIFFTVTETDLVLGDPGDGVVPRVYQHPGGMQSVGDVLAMALETPRQTGPRQACTICNFDPNFQQACDLCNDYDAAPNRTLISFFDVSDPENPDFLTNFVPTNAGGETLAGAGVIGITPLPDGHYLMVVTGGQNSTWFFYRSTEMSLKSEALQWVRVSSHPGDDVTNAHQTLNFLREGNIEGQLYLAGSRGRILSDNDRVDLYTVTCETKFCYPGEAIEVERRYFGQRITPLTPAAIDEQANLAAGGGFYVSPSGELIFYATEHDNDGPSASVKAGEWRHNRVVRDDSPTLAPSASIDAGPYAVDEGSTVQVSGSASPAVTKAWIQLYHDPDFSSWNWIADYEDHDLDDFGNLDAFERLLGVLPFHDDKVSSWKWFAPPGCSILAIDRDDSGNVDETVTLAGTGAVVEASDLALVLNDNRTDDINNELDGIDFLPGCDDYYSAAVSLHWDANVDGTYESLGGTVLFDAGALDGPSEHAVRARAQHPAGDTSAPVSTVVTVRNVAPSLSNLSLVDSAGQALGSDVPFALTGLPVTVAAAFSDPGLPDRQTASIAWGDGATDLESSFDLFDEAFGDGAGALRHAHRFAAAGQYIISVVVDDDDGGRGTSHPVVRIVTPEQAVQEIIPMLDALIAAATDDKIRANLRQARDALAGRNEYSNNGALNKIREGNIAAAIAMLNIALDWLDKVSTAGVDVDTVSALIRQVAAALAAA